MSRIFLYLRRQWLDLKEAARYFSRRRADGAPGLREHALGFADHRTPPADSDRALLERLIAAYEKAKAGEKNAAEPYRLRGEWERIIRVEYARLLSALERRDAKALGELLENFCRNECSRGLDMSAYVTMARRRPLARFLFVNSFNRSRENWLKAAGEFRPEDFAYPMVGNPVGMMIGGHLVPRVSIRHRYYAQRLLALPEAKEPVIVEIGGGFGGLAYFLFKESKRPIHYADFDLPEVNVVNGYFLLKAFPEKKILLYGETDEPLSEALKKCDAMVCPHYTFPELSDRSVDVVFNSNSMTEMDEQAVREYYRQIARVSRGHFFHVNHDDGYVYDAAKNQRHVKLSGHRLPEESFRAIHEKKPSFGNPNYFEYLYELKKS